MNLVKRLSLIAAIAFCFASGSAKAESQATISCRINAMDAYEYIACGGFVFAESDGSNYGYGPGPAVGFGICNYTGLARYEGCRRCPNNYTNDCVDTAQSASCSCNFSYWDQWTGGVTNSYGCTSSGSCIYYSF